MAFFVDFDLKNTTTWARFYDSSGLIGGTDPVFAPKNWGSNGSTPLGSVPAYYYNGHNTGGTFYPNDGSTSSSDLIAFSYTSDTDGLTPGSNADATNMPTAHGYTAQGIHFGRNNGAAIPLPPGVADLGRGLITGFIDVTGMHFAANSANTISILRPYAGGRCVNVQGIMITINNFTSPGNMVVNVDFFNIPAVGGLIVSQFRISGSLATPLPIWGFPIGVQWDFSGSVWKAQYVYSLLGRGDGTYHYDTSTFAVSSTGTSLTTGNQGECNAGAAMDTTACKIFSSLDPTHPMCLYFNAAPYAWLSDAAGSNPYPANDQPKQGSVYAPGTDVGFGAGLAPWFKVKYNYDAQFSQWMLTPTPLQTMSGDVFARRER